MDLAKSWALQAAAIVVAFAFAFGAWLALLVSETHRREEVLPAKCECPRQTPDEYRQELVDAARAVGWVCGPRARAGGL